MLLLHRDGEKISILIMLEKKNVLTDYNYFYAYLKKQNGWKLFFLCKRLPLQGHYVFLALAKLTVTKRNTAAAPTIELTSSRITRSVSKMFFSIFNH